MGRRYLQDDEKILVDQKVLGTEGLDRNEILQLYDYQPNDRILFLPWSPYVDLYQIGLKKFDTIKYEQKITKITKQFDQKIEKNANKDSKTQKLRDKKNSKINKVNRILKEGNLAMRMGEPLAIYDDQKEQATVNNIKNYLQANGYFDASVNYQKDEVFQMVTSIYQVNKKEPYLVDSIFYEVDDADILTLLEEEKNNSGIIKGENYNQQALVQERERINELLLNNGYYNFSRNQTSFAVDTTALDKHKVLIGIYIDPLQESRANQKYKIDSVIFTTDAEKINQPSKRDEVDYNGITFRHFERKYSEKILDWRVFLNKDSLYSRNDVLSTQRQLSNMDIFRFVNINFDTTGGQFIANIYSSALQKFQTSTEVGLNVNSGLPGPFFNASIKDRNVFKGLEIMELSGRVGFEGLSGASETKNPYSSLDYGANLSLTLPQFWFPLSNSVRNRFGRLNPKTRLSFGINFNYRLEYQRNTINSSILYSWQNTRKRITHNLALIDANYINSDITDQSFQDFLNDRAEEGNNLINSFNSAFVTSTWYSGTYNINDYGNKRVNSGFFKYRIETGGNWSGAYENLTEGTTIELYRFSKVDFDFRRHYPINTETAVAFRVHVGAAVPYGDNETLPYEKFYFAGGSNSIRAWEPRRLGPGSYIPIDSLGRYNNNFEQPGELIFETGIELRHRLFGFVKGAVFLDAGNVWTIQEDPSRPGAHIKAEKFIKELAVGAGYGFRFDLNFLLLRIDAAWKVVEPGRESIFGRDNRETLTLPNAADYNRLVWNLGIGFPF